jgi:hypothetical protein
MKKLLAFIFFGSVLFFSECKKYPEGPSISFRSKKERIANTWKIDALLKNDVDSAAYFNNVFKDYTLTLSKSGSYTISYYVVVPVLGNITNLESGSWTLTSDKKTITINPSSISVGSVPSASSWQILKLYENDFRVRSFDANGKKTEYHFIPK